MSSSTKTQVGKTKALEEKVSAHDVTSPSTATVSTTSPKTSQSCNGSPIEIRSLFNNSSSTKVMVESPSEKSKRSEATIGSVLSFLIPETISNLWSSGCKKGSAEESWVPTDPNEIVTFPEKELCCYDRIFPPDNVESPFQVRRGPITVRNVLDELKGVRCRSPQDRTITQEDILCHLIFAFVDGDGHRHFLTIYRSENADDVVELCQRCRDCCLLFRYIDKRKEDPVDFVRKLLGTFREHMLWRSAHVAAMLGMSEVFVDADERHRMRMLSTKCHPEGLYPLMIAIQNNQTELIAELINHGANLSQCDINGNNCLHFAAQYSQAALQVIWEKARTEFEKLVNVVNNDGCTPLYLAIRSANARCVSALLGYGASVNVRSSGMNPFFEAMQDKSKTLDLMRTLVTETSNELLYERDAMTGNTVLHVATQKQPLIALLELKGSQLDLNAKNHAGQTPLHMYTHKDDLQLVFAIAAYDVDLDLLDNDGHTALSIAVSRLNVEMVHALLILGANPNAGIGETPRHIAARFSRSNKEACEILRSVIMCGARRCSEEMNGCAMACANYDTLSAIETAKSDSAERTQSLSSLSMKSLRGLDSPEIPSPDSSQLKETNGPKEASQAIPYDFDLDPDRAKPRKKVDLKSPINYAQKLSIQKVHSYLDNLNNICDKNKYMVSALALDGGGIRGLATIQILLALQKYLEAPVFHYFDWVAGTSTGSLITTALASGFDLRHCLQFYLRFKDCIFDRWSRPYDAEVFEMLIQKAVGKERTLADIKYPKLIIPTVRAETFPVKMELMRNYELPLSEEENNELGYTSPADIKIWRAIRRSTAAPTYFTAAENRYLDGGIASNNPTLELLSEIHFWNSVLEYKRQNSRKVYLGCMLSVGTGLEPVRPLDPQSLEIGRSWVGSAMAIKSLGVVIVDQATLTEGAPVVRSRSWCHSMGVPYFRLNAPLTSDVPMDCKDDSTLCRMMWDCVEYAYNNREQLKDLAQLLKAIGLAKQRADVHGAVPIERTYHTFVSKSVEEA
uniref:phospholipase A2 n=1 Tax=Ascaris suum TaxID=6253 RepID=F1KTP9_ASCSU